MSNYSLNKRSRGSVFHGITRVKGKVKGPALDTEFIYLGNVKNTHSHAKLFNPCSNHYSGEQDKVYVNRKHKAFPNQVSLELFCCANTERKEGTPNQRPEK